MLGMNYPDSQRLRAISCSDKNTVAIPADDDEIGGLCDATI